jgi:ribosome biogenesis GTPase
MDDALHRLGLQDETDLAFAEHRASGLRLARVAAQHRGGYVLLSSAAMIDPANAPTIVELRADLSGRLRRAVAIDPAAGPAVGDWVAAEFHGEERPSATTHVVLPRSSKLSRKAVGRDAVEQLVAANVDTVFLVCALDQPHNLRRIERLLTIALESRAAAAIVLTKADLCPDPALARADLMPLCERAGVPLHVISSVDGRGLDELDIYTSVPRTSALIGASGVGKSTLINRWLGSDRQAVNAVRDDGKGRHTTTHRELLVLPRGGLVIDTPGMRELGLWRSEEGLLGAFADVAALTETCKFRDCSHAQEPGCAIQGAVAAGTLEPARAASFIKLQQEQAELDRARDGQARVRARQADRRSPRALSRAVRKD